MPVLANKTHVRAALGGILLLPLVMASCGPQPGGPRPQAERPSQAFRPPPLPPRIEEPRPIEDFLTPLEKECRTMAGMIRQFIGYRDAGVPMTTLRSEVRRLAQMAPVSPQEREKRVDIGLLLLNTIYGEPWLWVEPGASQRWEAICLQ